ncbi:hypothetical protein MRS44_015940 [Fusarium solani]|jgi:alpha-L-rhamnosidase|uniref:Uncharacterized protein n=1 Tax=Fusarium solani TaxID=169388 RepID=A0A9P9K7Y9_FUSSL|nr:uncharacterized protein B0J15DRAFT_549627 [Fusarium solani]KAH7252882.1 hypothetical protein B0J15DRAFT_549627 [Fusarium solani]KAJ3459867.1 hypothetical protein MRS44_015940 [Fusarium solani]
MAVFISKVTLEHHHDALGIGQPRPRISWRFGGNVVDWEQSTYALEIGRGFITKHHTSSNDSLVVPGPESPLALYESAEARVRAHGQPGQTSTPWSAWATVEAGLLSEASYPI